MSIVLEQITKRYEGHPVVNRVSLEVADGEFFVLIGPSGSGKSTVLRMIAGLNTVDNGRVLLHGRDVTGAPPQQRDVGFVFQHYALFRHMSVAENIEFALRVRKVAAADRRRRRDELLELVGLAGLGRRMPGQLSGGQQQRVALARALAHRPAVLLLDEPFGALDAKIRVELRRALREIQIDLGIATIFVTHDQEEAFELGDRLGVMNFGRLLEVGRPADLYQRPQTEFVATFLGTGNLLAGHILAGEVQVGPLRFPLPTGAAASASDAGAALNAGDASAALNAGDAGQPVQVLFRPEDVRLQPAGDGTSAGQLGQGHVEQKSFSGAFERVHVRLPAVAGLRPIAPRMSFGDNSFQVEATRSMEQARDWPLTPGDKVWVGVQRIHTLAHPGFSFLILSDGSSTAKAAVNLCGQMARMAHAQVTLLRYGAPAGASDEALQAAKEALGSGLGGLELRATAEALPSAVQQETERHAYDLVVAAPSASISATNLAQHLLRTGRYHVLLVPRTSPIPSRVLVCVTGSEPGKEDVLFAGSLLHYLGAEATLLSVVPGGSADPAQRERTEQFLADGARTMATLNITVETVIGTGPVVEAIRSQMAAGGHNMLMLGAPLAQGNPRAPMLGVIGQVLAAAVEQPVLIMRSRYARRRISRLTFDGRINIIEEIRP
jgi:sulfate transport system ATP-binding protein